MDSPKITHGGKRPDAGRKPKYGKRMVQKTVRLPREWIEKLTGEFGSFQEAVEKLASQHLSAGNG